MRGVERQGRGDGPAFPENWQTRLPQGLMDDQELWYDDSMRGTARV